MHQQMLVCKQAQTLHAGLHTTAHSQAWQCTGRYTAAAAKSDAAAAAA